MRLTFRTRRKISWACRTWRRNAVQTRPAGFARVTGAGEAFAAAGLFAVMVSISASTCASCCCNPIFDCW